MSVLHSCQSAQERVDRAHRRFVCLHMYTCTYSVKRGFTAGNRARRLQTLQGCSKGRPGLGRLRNQTMVGSFHAYIRTHVCLRTHMRTYKRTIRIALVSARRTAMRMASKKAVLRAAQLDRAPSQAEDLRESFETRAWRERVRELVFFKFKSVY